MTTILETAEQVKAADALFRWLANGCWVRRFRNDLMRDDRHDLSVVELGEWVIGYDADGEEIWTDLTVLPLPYCQVFLFHIKNLIYIIFLSTLHTAE
jgi:hypothetical protein